MNIKISNKDVFWGYFAQILTMGIGVLVLPFLLRLLNSDELGVWYIFQSFMFIANVLDFGFQPVFIRNISYLYGGATKLLKNGVAPIVTGSPNFRLLKVLIRDMKRFYMVVTALFLLVLVLIGFFYIRHIIEKSGLSDSLFLCWWLFVLTLCFNLYFSYYTCLLQGRGLVKYANWAVIISKILLAGVTVGALYLGYGLFSLVIGHFVSCIVNRILFAYFNRCGDFEKHIKNIQIEKKTSLFRIIYHNAYKQGLDGIGFFIKTQGLLLIVSYFLPLDITAMYGITVQMLGLLSTLSILYFRTYSSHFAQLCVLDIKSEIQLLFSKCEAVFLFSFLAGGFLLVLTGNFFLEIIGSKTLLFSYPLLIFMVITEFLEYHYMLASYFIAINNEVPFYKSSLLTSILIVLLAVILVKFLGWGIWGIVFAHFIMNLFYNCWKWPLEATKILSMRYSQIIETGFSFFYNKIYTYFFLKQKSECKNLRT